jgi:hypothetical protein
MDGGEFGMRLLRGIAGALLWIVSLLLMLVGVILCVTVILLPVGIPLLGYARRMFTGSLKLMAPRAVSHPIEQSEKAMKKRGHDVRKSAKRTRKKLGLA